MSFSPYYLDTNSSSLGINREDLTAPFNALIASSSVYKNNLLYTLMKYEEKGKYYLFEDEFIISYCATLATKKSSNFIELRPKEFTENEEAKLYLSKNIKEGEKISSICFKFKKKVTQKSYSGVFITPSCITEIFDRIKVKNIPIEDRYLLPKYFIFLESINPKTIHVFFDKLSKWGDKKLERNLCKLIMINSLEG